MLALTHQQMYRARQGEAEAPAGAGDRSSVWDASSVQTALVLEAAELVLVAGAVPPVGTRQKPPFNNTQICIWMWEAGKLQKWVSVL